MIYNLCHLCTEFQSYHETKGLCNGIPVTVERYPSLVGFEPTTATVRGPAPNLPCKIIASLSKNCTSFQECLSLNAKILTYQIKKMLFNKKKKRKLFFSN